MNIEKYNEAEECMKVKGMIYAIQDRYQFIPELAAFAQSRHPIAKQFISNFLREFCVEYLDKLSEEFNAI